METFTPIWWCGAEISRAVIRRDPIPFTKIFIALGTLTAGFGIYVAIAFIKGQQLSFGVHPLVEMRNTGSALAMVAILLWYRRSLRDLGWLLAPFSAIAPISYGIYALHLPLMNNEWALALPIAVRLPIEILVVLFIAWFAEIPYQRFVLSIAHYPNRSGLWWHW